MLAIIPVEHRSYIERALAKTFKVRNLKAEGKGLLFFCVTSKAVEKMVIIDGCSSLKDMLRWKAD